MSDLPSSDRRDFFVGVAIVSAFAGLALATPIRRRFARHPTAEDCVRVLDLYAEAEAREYERDPPSRGAPRPQSAPEVVRCTREWTASEVECALASGDADQIERCLW